MYPPHALGFIGEQDAGFFFGARGYGFITGPGGTTGGHRYNAPGFDGAAYNAVRDHLILYDNKAFRRECAVSRATAIDPLKNLAQNLLQTLAVALRISDLPRKGRVLQLLQLTHQAVVSGRPWPHQVSILVTNAWGKSTDVSKAFNARGIRFLNIYSKKVRPPQPGQWLEAFEASPR
jgi:hypothetical protein